MQGVAVLALAAKGVLDQARAIHEEIGGVVPAERLDLEARLAGELEAFPRGNQELDPGRLREPPAEGGGGVLDDCLEIIEDQQRAGQRRERVGELARGLGLRRAGGEGHLDGRAERGEDLVGRSRSADIAEEDFPHRPVGEGALAVLLREPGLADPRGTDQGHEPRVGGEDPADCREVRLAPDEPGRLGGHRGLPLARHAAGRRLRDAPLHRFHRFSSAQGEGRRSGGGMLGRPYLVPGTPIRKFNGV